MKTKVTKKPARSANKVTIKYRKPYQKGFTSITVSRETADLFLELLASRSLVVKL